MNLKDIHDRWAQAHTQFYSADPKAELQPMLAFIKDEQIFVMVGKFVTDGDKAQFIKHARENVRTLKPDAYVFCSETWIGTDPSKRPSEQMDRRKGVLTTVVASNGEKLASIMEINRDWTTGDKVLSEVAMMEGDHVSGTFAELFDAEA